MQAIQNMFQMLYLEILLLLFRLLFCQLFLVFRAHILQYNFLLDSIFHLVVLNITFSHLDVPWHIVAFALKPQNFFQHLLVVLLVQIYGLEILYLYYYKLFVDNLLIVYLCSLHHNILKIFQLLLY